MNTETQTEPHPATHNENDATVDQNGPMLWQRQVNSYSWMEWLINGHPRRKAVSTMPIDSNHLLRVETSYRIVSADKGTAKPTKNTPAKKK